MGPPEPLTREAKIQEILNVAAYNNYLDEMDREAEAAATMQPLDFETHDDSSADESELHQMGDGDVWRQEVPAVEMSESAPAHALPEEALEDGMTRDASAELQLAVAHL